MLLVHEFVTVEPTHSTHVINGRDFDLFVSRLSGG